MFPTSSTRPEENLTQKRRLLGLLDYDELMERKHEHPGYNTQSYL